MASPVPIDEWQKAFSLVVRDVAKAAKLARSRNPEKFNVPNGTNLVRWAVMSYVLPRLREALAQKPGIETAEEIYRIAMSILANASPRQIAEEYAAKRPKRVKDVDQLASMIAETLDVLFNVINRPAVLPA